MRNFIILIVSILSVNFAPALAKTSCFYAYGCIEFDSILSPFSSITIEDTIIGVPYPAIV